MTDQKSRDAFGGQSGSQPSTTGDGFETDRQTMRGVDHVPPYRDVYAVWTRGGSDIAVENSETDSRSNVDDGSSAVNESAAADGSTAEHASNVDVSTGDDQ